MEIAIIMIIVLLSGFFSGSEIAFVSASRIKMEIESRKASPVGRALHYFMQNGHEFLSTTLIGNNIINVLYATLMAIFLEGPLITLYEGWQGVEPNPFLLLLTQTVIASVVIMIFGEIVPKTIFRSQADAVVHISSCCVGSDTAFGLMYIRSDSFACRQNNSLFCCALTQILVWMYIRSARILHSDTHFAILLDVHTFR